MEKHTFILEPGHWIGEGKVTFSISTDFLRFYTRWQVTRDENGLIHAQQQVEMQGSDEAVINNFIIKKLSANTFDISLENQLLGVAVGKGVLDEKTLAWEFRDHQNFDGFEVYELQENGDYLLHAEYDSQDQFRTIIDGKIWKKLDY
jgi:hypothetical protein